MMALRPDVSRILSMVRSKAASRVRSRSSKRSATTASLRNNHIGVGKDTVRTNRTIELIRVMAFGEVNHKINIAILKMLLAKVLLFFRFCKVV